MAAAAVGPLGLTLRGRTSKLAWTARLRRLAGASAVLAAVPIAGLGVRRVGTRLSPRPRCAPWGRRCLVDLALLLMKGPEARLLRPYVEQASQRLSVGQAPGRGHYGFLRQDDHEGLCRPPGRRQHVCGRQPGQFQQHPRAWLGP